VSSAQAPPLQVSRFEANLLRIARFFFHQVPAEEALPLVRENQSRPRCLSAAAVHLVRDTLAKGCVLNLVRAGGWRHERFLRNGEPKDGRLWERSPIDELALEFSADSLEFLIWLTTHKPGETTQTWRAPPNQLTVGDQLFLFLAYEAIREEPDIAVALRSSPNFALHPLIVLMNPGDFAGEPTPDAISFNEWTIGQGALVLEAMQPLLEARWLENERSKGQIGDWDRLRQQGVVELAVLERFLGAAESAGRWDLARFLLGILNKLLATPDMTPTFWTGGLQGSGPPRLADRLETQRSALSVLRQADRLRQWEQRARRSGYMDEDYAASKFWLGEWERLIGTQSTARAAQVVQMLEPLRASESTN
jgi:FtsH ternary system domain X6